MYLAFEDLTSVVRLMRITVPEIFVELGEHIYAHTPYSLIYLKAEGMFRFVYVNSVILTVNSKALFESANKVHTKLMRY
jgi:hypothetical protein